MLTLHPHHLKTSSSDELIGQQLVLPEDIHRKYFFQLLDNVALKKAILKCLVISPPISDQRSHDPSLAFQILKFRTHRQTNKTRLLLERFNANIQSEKKITTTFVLKNKFIYLRKISFQTRHELTNNVQSSLTNTLDRETMF